MCYITAWKTDGSLPRGLISHLIIEGQARGVDSAGLAWRDGDAGENIVYKRAVKPSTFVLKDQETILQARKSPVGLLHTRRASLHMPLTTAAAQPLWHGKTVYVHNGFVRNWKIARQRDSLAATVADDAVQANKIMDDWITDSYVLGPRLDEEEADLSDLCGSMSLAWLVRQRVFATRLAKELEGFVLEWEDETGPRTASLVGSTVKIVTQAIDKIKTDVSLTHVTLVEGKLYELEPDGIYELGDVSYTPTLLSLDKASSATAPIKAGIQDA